jgi:hypothetical protein
VPALCAEEQTRRRVTASINRSIQQQHPPTHQGSVMPQKSWSAKRERQYVHIKGRSTMNKTQLEAALTP